MRPFLSTLVLLLLAAPAWAVEGYADRLSYRPGDTVQLYASTKADSFKVEVFRVGPTRVPVHRNDKVAGKFTATPADASANGCRWPVLYSMTIPDDWRSGYYVARLSIDPKAVDEKPVASEVFFVVRATQPGKDSKMLLQLTTNTYNAYCNWGGYSLYAYNGKHKIQGRRVSFDRPLAGQFDRWELPFVQWAEKNGYRLEYAVNSDLEFHPELLDNYQLVLSVGHDEYWSSPMRDTLERFIARGGNVAFFSGNTCCWQVRSEDAGRALACWKQSFGDDPYYRMDKHRLMTTLWSHYLVGRPENELTGVGFLHGGYRKSHGQFMEEPAEYTVHRPEHWLFAGTSLKAGDVFGNKDTIVGYECDGCEFTLKGGLPVPTGRDGTPRDFQILASCPARWHPDDCEWYEKWEKGRTGAAVLGTYTRGGTVVTVGSTDWSHGLKGNDPVVMRVTKNVLDRLSKPASAHWVQATAYVVPKETAPEGEGYFAIIEGKNGKLYIGTHANAVNSWLVEFDPATSTMKTVVDSHKAIGTDVKGFAAQAKIHTRNNVGASGKVYFGTKQGYPAKGEARTDYPGGYPMAYDPATGKTEVFPIPVPHQGINSVMPDESRGLLYVSTCSDERPIESAHFLVLDLKTRKNRDLLDTKHSYGFLVLDNQGRAYHPVLGGTIARYDPRSDKLETLQQTIDGKPLPEGSLLGGPDSNHPLNWDATPDGKTLYCVAMSENRLYAYDLTAAGDTLPGRTVGELIPGATKTDCRALCVGPTGEVWASVTEKALGVSLHHVVRYRSGEKAPVDLGPVAIRNPDFTAFTDAAGKPLPYHHGMGKMADGMTTTKHAILGICQARDGRVYSLALSPYTVLQIDPRGK